MARPLPLLLCAGVLIVASAVVWYVQDTVRSVQAGLPAAVLAQEREIVAVAEALAELRFELHGARLAPSDSARRRVMERLGEAEQRLASMRQTYNFDNLVGASAVHAIANPALIDVRRWLEQGVGANASPMTPIVLALAGRRIDEATQAVRAHLADAQASAIELLARQGQDLERFRAGLIGVIVLVAALVLMSIALVVRQSAERQRAAAALATLNRRLAERNAAFDIAIENTRHGLAFYDAAMRLQVWNRRYPQMFGIPAGALRAGMSLADVMRLSIACGNYAESTAESVIAERLLIAAATEPRTFHQRLRTGRLIEAVQQPLPDGGRVISFTDITDQERREAELRHAKDAAEMASRTKSQFLATMSHELRTPLNAIIGFSEIIANAMIGPLHPKYREYGVDIHRSGQHLLDLINDILDLSKIEHGRLKLHEAPADLGEIVRSSVRLLGTRASEGGVHVLTEIAPDLPTVRVDELRLKQALLNLLSNAVKFTPAGGRVTISARLVPTGDIEIRVEDTGIGMSPEDIPIALEPFRQIDGRLNRRYEGTGLGLPLAKALVELHGGQLVVESEPGRGTTVSFRLPRERVSTAA
ncbi:MAG TPA: ATP-binding protein [Alphaproteobacteria bacterium]